MRSIDHPYCKERFMYTRCGILYVNAYELGYEKDYHEQAAFYIEGNLDIDIFNKAVSELVNETTSLNLSYSLQDMLATTHRRDPRSELHRVENVPKDLDSFVRGISSRDLEKAFDPNSEHY